MNEAPVLGLFMANLYWAISAFSFLVSFEMNRDIRNQFTEKRIVRRPLRHRIADGIVTFLTWPKHLRRDWKVIRGKVEPKPLPAPVIGSHIRLQRGISIAAGCLGVERLIWAELNTAWISETPDLFFNVALTVCVLYLFAYSLHLQTIWQRKPHRWRLLLTITIIAIPLATAVRVLTY